MALTQAQQAILSDPNLSSYLTSPQYYTQFGATPQEQVTGWVQQLGSGLLGRPLSQQEVSDGAAYLAQVGYDPVQFISQAFQSPAYQARGYGGAPDRDIAALYQGVTGAAPSPAELSRYYQMYTGQPYTGGSQPQQPPAQGLPGQPPPVPTTTPTGTGQAPPPIPTLQAPSEPPPQVGAPGVVDAQPNVDMTSATPWGIGDTVNNLAGVYNTQQSRTNPFGVPQVNQGLTDLYQQQQAKPNAFNTSEALQGLTSLYNQQQGKTNPFGVEQVNQGLTDLFNQQQSRTNPFDTSQTLAGLTDLFNQQHAALSPFFTGPVGFSDATQAGVQAFEQNALPVIQHQMELQGLGGSPALGNAMAQGLATALPGFIQNDMANRLAASQMYQPWAQAALGLGGLGQQEAQTGLNEADLWSKAAFNLGSLGQQQQQMGLNEADLWSKAALGLGGLGQQEQQTNLGESKLWSDAALGLGGLGQQEQQRNLGEANLWANTALGVGGQAIQDEGLTQNAAKLSADISNQEATRQLQAMLGAGNLLTGLSQPLSALGGLTQQQQQMLIQSMQGAGGLQRDVAQQGADAELMDWLRRQGLSESSSTGLFGSSVIPPSLTSATSSKGK